MKTIGIRDRGNPTGYVHIIAGKPGQNHHERILQALEDYRHVGNINILLIQGRKYRRILERPGF